MNNFTLDFTKKLSYLAYRAKVYVRASALMCKLIFIKQAVGTFSQATQRSLVGIYPEYTCMHIFKYDCIQCGFYYDTISSIILLYKLL